MTNTRIFITNLGKYNEGELIGKWLDLPVTEDELTGTLEEIGINEEYEEFFITDKESNYSAITDTIDEYSNIEELSELIETIENLDEHDSEKLCAILEYFGDSSIDDYISSLDDYNLMSDVHSDYDLGYYYIEESGCYNLESMGNLARYFDYEAFGRDIELEADGGFTSYGFIERI